MGNECQIPGTGRIFAEIFFLDLQMVNMTVTPSSFISVVKIRGFSPYKDSSHIELKSYRIGPILI